VDNQENEWQRYLGPEVFKDSLVEVCGSNRKAIGCFVTPTKILTCLHPFEDVDLDQLTIVSINGEQHRYEVVSTATDEAKYPDIDLLVIEVKVDRYRNRACIELDLEADDLVTDNFGIYHPSLNSSDLIPITSLSSSQSSKKLEFYCTSQTEVNLVGCPIVNRRTGLVYGIVSELDNNNDSTSSSRQMVGRAISVGEIIKKRLDVRAGNQYITNVLCNLPEKEERKLIGREDELQTLFQYLSPLHAQHVVEINGTTGVGKSELAIAAANKSVLSHQEIRAMSKIPIFDAVVFISLENNNRDANQNAPNAGLLQILGTIGDTLKIPNFDRNAEAENFKRVYEALTNDGKRTTLLILDGWDDSSDADRIWDFLDSVPAPTKVIITARERKSPCSYIFLQPLTLEQSKHFILKQAAIEGLKLKDSEITKILDSALGVPILLTQAIDRFRAGKYKEDREFNLAEAIDPATFEIDRSIDSIEGTSTAEILQVLSFFATSASMSATVAISSKLLASKQGLELEKALDTLERLELMKFESVGKKTRYQLLPNVRKCVLDRSVPLLDKNKDEDKYAEVRSKWVEWYCNFVKSSPIDELEDEWENIKEVLMWCENEVKFKFIPIKEIWMNIDLFVERKQDWTIRFYWWKYLNKEFADRGRTLLQMEALLALVDTCLKMGNKQLTQSYLSEASQLLKDESEYELNKNPKNSTVRQRYVETVDKLKGEVEVNSMPVASLAK
jgi:hypothetical protein